MLGDFGGFLQQVMHKKHSPAFRCMLLGMHIVVVDNDVYEESLAKLDISAQFVPFWPTGFRQLLGINALQFQAAGSGPRGARHRRMKRKVIDALTPSELRGFLPRIEAIIRDEFEGMADETVLSGSTALMPHAMRIVKRVILELLLGPDGILAEDYIRDTSKVLMDGMIGVPLDLGRFSAYRRAMRIRRGYERDVQRQLRSVLGGRDCAGGGDPGGGTGGNSPAAAGWGAAAPRTMLDRLTQEFLYGAGLTTEAMQDLFIFLLFGGSLTSAETMQWLVVELSRHPKWLAKVSEEQQRLAGMDGGLPAAWGSVPPEGSRTPCPLSLASCYETLRLHAPAEVLPRWVQQAVHLGKGRGTIPAGWLVVVHLTARGLREGPAFDPSRWVGRAAASEVTAFGLGPHICVGRQLALWELQVFFHVWFTSYDMEVLRGDTYHLAGMKRFSGVLPVAVRRRDARRETPVSGAAVAGA